MQMSRLLRTLPALLACALAAPLAHATSYEIGSGSSVTANTGDPLLISTSFVSGLNNVAFDLNDGESYTFGFFKIWTTEGNVGSEDTTPVAISATLDFDNPFDENANFLGVTFGGTAYFGFAQWGQVVWDAPVTLSSGGLQFEISLSNETFNSGTWWGLDEGKKKGAIVEATVRQVSSNVPDSGSTAALLGLALVGIGAIARRRS
jgi:hypothetical protein